MGCNCGGATATPKVYVYVGGDGRERKYGTEIEAKAAQVRAGGVGSIRVENKK